ncbi:nicotinamide-nucleotide amidase [Homoserinimonas aerilata]|uniref:Nicotinamide-nucleotide amidase n=1 Tax=Homoserinimonas aerilata TaxID=1162970 RepID=A0A542YJV4_9MICO|nr:nicotinamide-nucleotide amidohydrolase family protein [Homoserinimonas aerilata]TQL48373.1 nicotinamide-nucleotide amidase [Homoserinimonas aerilata]
MTASDDLVHLLIERRLTIAVAESLTGGMLVSELVSTPGASAAVLGGVVAYNTELKHSMLGVDSAVINVHGVVHPDVAAQMAVHVRELLAVGGLPADIGVSTTGVAGPEPQDGQPVGTVFVGVSLAGDVRVVQLDLSGDRESIRRQVVDRAIDEVLARLSEDAGA